MPAYVGLDVMAVADLQPAFPGARPFVREGYFPVVHLASLPGPGPVSGVDSGLLSTPPSRIPLFTAAVMDGTESGLARDFAYHVNPYPRLPPTVRVTHGK